MAPDVIFHQPINSAAENGQGPKDYYSQGLRAKFLIDGVRATEEVTALKQSPEYADISYEVDRAAFQRRTENSLRAGGLTRSLPEGWPEKLQGPLVWTKDDICDESEYVFCLSDADNAEIRGALEHFKDQDLHGCDVSRATFPLPVLERRLDQICCDVYEGRGFAILRGLDTDSYTVEDLTVAYLGLSSYVGEKRGRQDQRGSMLMHVIQRSDDEADQNSEDKPFHTDTVADCLCLFTQSLAAEGGRSVLASSWTVYNELAATRPDLLHVLAARDWPFDTYGRRPAFYKRAIMYYHKEKLITSFSRRLLVGHAPSQPRTPGIPGLTEKQAEALDAVHFIARKHEIKPKMVKGDLRFINNMAILHRREAFENRVNQARHLVRLWLNNGAMCWELPHDLRIAWARVFDEEGREKHWDIVPPRKGGKILRIAGSCD